MPIRGWPTLAKETVLGEDEQGTLLSRVFPHKTRVVDVLLRFI